MKINSELGYKPVTFSELTTSEDFWKGCRSCKNYQILQDNDRRMCLCTGMLFDAPEPVPAAAAADQKSAQESAQEPTQEPARQPARQPAKEAVFALTGP